MIISRRPANRFLERLQNRDPATQPHALFVRASLKVERQRQGPADEHRPVLTAILIGIISEKS
jgi:hypothetical protein